MPTYDAIIVGLGGMGSATAYHLAKRGYRVLGLEQFPLVHAHGSSHGKSRVIRTAYYEHPAYVPLVKRAFPLWQDLEQATGTKLLTMTGCLNLGPANGELIAGVRQSAQDHSLPVELLRPQEIMNRFPPFRIPPDWSGLYEHQAGALAVEECVRAHLSLAKQHGADLQAEETVTHWKTDAKSVMVTTNKGTYSAAKLIVTAGAWATTLLKDALGVPLTVMRQVMLWFAPPDTRSFAPDRFPVFLADTPVGAFYGMPALDGGGVKVARHFGAMELPSPSDVVWDTTDADETSARLFLSEMLPSLSSTASHRQVCMYTLTPDRHFVIDHLPGTPEVIVAAGFSGHGFKFAPTVGEILADLFERGVTPHTIDLFRANRFPRTNE